jgi:hypothetical protein
LTLALRQFGGCARRRSAMQVLGSIGLRFPDSTTDVVRTRQLFIGLSVLTGYDEGDSVGFIGP